MHPGSRNRLMPAHAALFPGDTLFDRLARALCDLGCLPRKELYESWEMARRVRRRFRGGRVIDWAAGHGLLAQCLLLLDDSSPEAVAYDIREPPSAARVHDGLCALWPRLRGRVMYTNQRPDLRADDLVVSCHACGTLTDEVLDAAREARARVAVMPCCHAHGRSDPGGLEGWLDPSLAIDVTRAARLRSAGYQVHTARIDPDVTPKNRLLLGAPPAR